MNSTFPSGLIRGDLATGGAIAIIAIVMVFVVLLSIIVITELVGKLTANLVKEAPAASAAASVAPASTSSPLNMADEDATVAALVASIDYREETKMNIRVVSVKEVK